MRDLLRGPCQNSRLSSTSIGGSVVECSPATRAARVRFPADATCFVYTLLEKGTNIRQNCMIQVSCMQLSDMSSAALRSEFMARNSLLRFIHNTAVMIRTTLIDAVLVKVLSPRRGIEPRSPAWQAGILTTILSRITGILVAITWSNSRLQVAVLYRQGVWSLGPHETVVVLLHDSSVEENVHGKGYRRG